MEAQVYTFVGVMLAVMLALFGYVFALRAEVSRVGARHDVLVDAHCAELLRIPEVEHKLDMLMGQTDVYFRTMDKFIAATIHSPIHTDRDELMEKLEHGTLTLHEAERLQLMVQAMVDEEQNSQKLFAGMLGLARLNSLIWRMRSEQERGMSGLCR